jgi:hypothetical protein
MTIRERPTLTKLNSEAHFINQANSSDLTGLSLEGLAQRYNDIDQQSQIYKGLILLEARGRFSSDKEFGQWIATHGLSVSSQQNRTLFMNLARFFKDKDMRGISLTAAYEISRPDNSDVAEKIYAEVLNKNLSVSEIKRKIKVAKSVPAIDASAATEEEREEQDQNLSTEEQVDAGSIVIETEVVKKPGDLIDLTLSHLGSLNLDLFEKIEVLKKCLDLLQAKLEVDTAA